MKTVMKIFAVIFIIVLSLGFFFTPKSYAEYPPDYKIVTVYIDGHWVKTVYAPDGGIVEVIIDNND
jgi:hypothetical protein